MTALVVLATFLAFFVLWRFVFFFRNPRRCIVADDDVILSPADGFVMYVRRVRPDQAVFAVKKGQPILLDDLMFLDDPDLPRDGWLIGIFMSPLDVHYNRAPIRGVVRRIAHRFPGRGTGRNATMFPGQSNLFFDLAPYWQGCDYLVANERASYVFANEAVHVYVTQIADRWIRRIVCFRDCGQVAQGDVFGLIRMGSQVDLFVPDVHGRMTVLVTERQHVKAGLTALIRMTGASKQEQP